MRLLLVPALLAFAFHLNAEDMSLSDLRLSGGVLSNHFTGASTTTVTNSGGTVINTTTGPSDGRDSDHNYRGAITLMFGHLGPFGGFIYGADIGFNSATFNNSGTDARATTPLVDVLLGYGIAPTPFWHLELTPFAGAGRTYYSVSSSGTTTTSKDWQKYIEYGVRLGSYWTLPNNFQLGVEVPYLVGRFKPDYHSTDSGGNTVSVSDDRQNRGFGVQASLGVRF